MLISRGILDYLIDWGLRSGILWLGAVVCGSGLGRMTGSFFSEIHNPGKNEYELQWELAGVGFG
jgi:hypothetical protein